MNTNSEQTEKLRPQNEVCFFYNIILCFPLFSFGQNNFLNSAQSLGIGDCYTIKI